MTLSLAISGLPFVVSHPRPHQLFVYWIIVSYCVTIRPKSAANKDPLSQGENPPRPFFFCHHLHLYILQAYNTFLFSQLFETHLSIIFPHVQRNNKNHYQKKKTRTNNTLRN